MPEAAINEYGHPGGPEHDVYFPSYFFQHPAMETIADVTSRDLDPSILTTLIPGPESRLVSS